MESNNSSKRGVNYVRVSKEEQKKEGYSLQSQVRLCRERMERDGVKEVHPPIEDAESGRNFERRGIEDLIKLAEDSCIDYVYVHSLDRLGRNVAETPYFMYRLKELGVTVRTPEREYKLEKPMDFVIAVIDSLPPDEESRKIGERTRRGKVQKFMEGKWVGPIPFGYKKIEERLEKIPELERVILEIFEAYKRLKDVKKVTNEINERYAGVVGKFSVHHIRRTLSNRIYIGHPSFGKEEITNPALAMLPQELFDEVQRLLEEKAKKSRVKKARKPHSILDDWARKFGIDYVARVLDVLKAHCPRCKDVHMVGAGSKNINGVMVPRFKCPSCGYIMPVPSGAKIECFVGGNSLFAQIQSANRLKIFL